MEKEMKLLLSKIYNELGNYDLFNYLGFEFNDDVEKFYKNANCERVIEYIQDSIYDIDMEYYRNKNIMSQNVALGVLEKQIENLKKESMEMLKAH